jgi:hypothetical protein
MYQSIGLPNLFCVGWPNMKSTLGDRVKRALEGPPKRSQAALAKACGVHPVSVNDWVHDRTQRIEGAHLLNAAAFLGVNPRWLADGLGPMRSPSSEGAWDLVEPHLRERGNADHEPSASSLVRQMVAIAAPLRPTLRKNLANLLVDLIEHPDDAALIEQTITDIELFFKPSN